MLKMDFFKADRYLSIRVAEYVNCKILKKEIQLIYAKKIEELTDSINKLDNLKGSILEYKIPEMRKVYTEQLGIFVMERDARLEAEAKFVLSEHDKNFKKAMAKAGTATDLQTDAVCAWFDTFALDIRNTYFLDEILAFFGGKFSWKEFVKTDCNDGRVMDVTRALDMMYWSAYTHMVRVGTIKPAQLPSLIREKYAPKPKKAKKTKKDDAKKEVK